MQKGPTEKMNFSQTPNLTGGVWVSFSFSYKTLILAKGGIRNPFKESDKEVLGNKVLSESASRNTLRGERCSPGPGLRGNGRKNVPKLFVLVELSGGL